MEIDSHPRLCLRVSGASCILGHAWDSRIAPYKHRTLVSALVSHMMGRAKAPHPPLPHLTQSAPLRLHPAVQGIVFSVRPPKKSWKNIANLSGGEKTLASLALVFALHHYKPTPLYVMDEIDAALGELLSLPPLLASLLLLFLSMAVTNRIVGVARLRMSCRCWMALLEEVLCQASLCA